MTSTTRRNKTNAQRAQKEFCAAVGKHFNLKVGAVMDEPYTCDIKPQCMGESGEDIVMCSQDALKMGFSFEIKYGLGYTKIVNAHDQAISNCDGRIPIVGLKPSRSKKKYIVLELNDFLKLIGNDDEQLD